MDGFLRQSTASQSRALGPFISDSDFKTAQTALTIANTDVKLLKNGAASVDKNSGGGTHRVNGFYGVTFDATDTDTVGELKYSVVVAGAQQVFGSYTVLEEAVYDAKYAASAAGWASAADVAAIPAAVLASVVENSKTLVQYLRIIKAAVIGKLSGAETTTILVRDDADSKNRISATVDANGNRSAVTLDGT